MSFEPIAKPALGEDVLWGRRDRADVIPAAHAYRQAPLEPGYGKAGIRHLKTGHPLRPARLRRIAAGKTSRV